MEKIQESVNKGLEELKQKHAETNNKITEIKNTLEGINNSISVVLAQKEKYRPMEQDRKPRDKPMHLWKTLTKEVRIYNGGKTASSISGAGKTG